MSEAQEAADEVLDGDPEAPVADKIVPATERLKCQLTEEEWVETAEQMSEAIDALKELEDDRQAFAKDMKARMAAKEAEVNRLNNLCRAKYEWRDAPCQRRFDFNNRKIVVTRDDTGEVVWSREMREDELQMELEQGPPEEPEARIEAGEGSEGVEDEDE